MICFKNLAKPDALIGVFSHWHRSSMQFIGIVLQIWHITVKIVQHFQAYLLLMFIHFYMNVQATCEKIADQLIDQLLYPRPGVKRPRKSQQPRTPRRWQS
jgi:hypothetical protein